MIEVILICVDRFSLGKLGFYDRLGKIVIGLEIQVYFDGGPSNEVRGGVSFWIPASTSGSFRLRKLQPASSGTPSKNRVRLLETIPSPWFPRWPLWAWSLAHWVRGPVRCRVVAPRYHVLDSPSMLIPARYA